jgi:formate hydrogenlyase subunit 6/NADH:ubiquinone oxidoreductase subunit I
MSVFVMTRTVLRNLFSRPATRRYPGHEKEPHRAPRSRGHIAIDIDVCIFCGACAKRCPTDAIIVTKPVKEWNIDRLRCCSCNACVEVCPVKCLTMDNRYTSPTVTRDKDIFRQPPKPAAQEPPPSAVQAP